MVSSLNHPALYFNVESAKLRTGLRAYFTILFFIFAIVARRCCIDRGRLRIFRRQPTRVSFFTGWLPAPMAIDYWIRMRSLPAGWLGIVMILITFLSLLSDIAVAGLVSTKSRVGRCAFGVGIVIPSHPTAWRSEPSNQQRGFWMVSSAHDTSRRNGGKTGIYWKANAEPNFRADDKDILGGWECRYEVDKTVNYVNDTDALQIESDLQSRGLLFNSSTFCANRYPDDSRSDLLFLSASVPNNVWSPWDLRVSLDVVQKGNHNPIKMESFRCEMKAQLVDWILARINSGQTLSKWCVGIYGSIENRTIERTSLVLVDTLNTMIMVGWGGIVSAQESPNRQSPDPDPSSQGCLIQRAAVPWPVLSLVFTNSAILLLMIFFWAVLRIQLASFSRKLLPADKFLGDQAPGELLHWMRLFIEGEARKDNPEYSLMPGNSSRIEYGRWKIGIQQDTNGFKRLVVNKCA